MLDITGPGTDRFRGEVGGHRIQRIPPGEKRGRVHSSTVTVAVLDGVAASTMEIPGKDLEIQWFSGVGCGGQHRNKTQNSCRIRHIPSGIVRTAQTRSRENSRAEAMAALQAAVLERSREENSRAENAVRSAHVGTGERGDKRRTYRWQEGLVHDHVTGRSASLERVMKGDFSSLWR